MKQAYSTPPTQTLDRALGALEALRDSVSGDLSLTELSHHVDLHKSTLHRFLATLEKRRWVERDPVSQRYRLGLIFLDFAHRAVERIEARRHALGVMRVLARDSGESVYLNVLSGTRSLCVEEVVPPGGVTLGSNVGVWTPVQRSASGCCFLAWLPARERLTLINRASVEGAAVGSKSLTRRLEHARRLGYAVNDEETEKGVLYVAAPVFDAEGRVAAALALGVPTLKGRPRLPRLGAAVAAAAVKVSRSLGHAEMKAPA